MPTAASKPLGDNMTENSCDVFVIGGGPAGSTVAALLAERGFHVVLAEKDRHPRFHIGESLLPLNMPLLDRLGVRDRVETIAMHKYAAEFNSPQHERIVTFDFGLAWDRSYPLAYQVKRSEFDQILFDHCVAKGALAMQECKVTAVELKGRTGAQVKTRAADGGEQSWDARFLVDASGRDTFLAGQLGIKKKNRKHNSAALYSHFEGAQRLPGRAEGNISIFWFEHGWFWFIPLKDGVTSVGAVCWPYYLKTRRTDPSTFLLDTIALCPALAARMEGSKMLQAATATGNYSYESRHMVGDGYILLGDAYAFVDPVFSSGVLLAMNSAFLGADLIEAQLRNPARAPALIRNYNRVMRHGVKNFSWFIYRMTSPAMRALFMNPQNHFRMQDAVLSLLAGDLFRGTPIYRSLRVFKTLYYVFSLFMLKQCVTAWLRRRRAIRDVGEISMLGSKA
jgi:flavin-dependent dehydrogenase